MVTAQSTVVAPSPIAFSCHEPAAMVRILDPSCNVVVLRRAARPAIRRYMEAAFSEERLVKRVVDPAESLAAMFPCVANLETERALAMGDVDWMLEAFCDLVEPSQVGIRIAALQHAMCPRFHVDRVGIRMLTTYTGPATEYLEEQDVDRARLVTREEAARPGARVQVADSFDVVLLKGETWPGNEGRGAVHRSPNVPSSASPRVVVTLDAIYS